LRAGPAHRIRARLRRGDPGGQCLVCQARLGATQRALSDLPGGRQTPPAAVSLCVRHHLALRATDQRASRALTHGVVEQADRLIGELADQFERIAQARSRRALAPDIRAWRRAAAFLDGAVFGGMPTSEP
jgi:hypothetical protein